MKEMNVVFYFPCGLKYGPYVGCQFSQILVVLFWIVFIVRTDVLQLSFSPISPAVLACSTFLPRACFKNLWKRRKSRIRPAQKRLGPLKNRLHQCTIRLAVGRRHISDLILFVLLMYAMDNYQITNKIERIHCAQYAAHALLFGRITAPAFELSSLRRSR